MEGLNSKLNLNAGAPPRVWPRLGEWGPANVPSTRQKKRMRWFVALGFVAWISFVEGVQVPRGQAGVTVGGV